jgi:hypothetical protein
MGENWVYKLFFQILKDCDGVVCGIHLWLFGVNGVVPLYLRGYSVEEQEHNVDHDATKGQTHYYYYDDEGKTKTYTIKEVKEWQHDKKDEEKFIKMIVTELIEHRGHPFQEIMQKTMEKLKSFGDKTKWHDRAVKFEEAMTTKLTKIEQKVKVSKMAKKNEVK